MKTGNKILLNYLFKLHFGDIKFRLCLIDGTILCILYWIITQFTGWFFYIPLFKLLISMLCILIYFFSYFMMKEFIETSEVYNDFANYLDVPYENIVKGYIFFGLKISEGAPMSDRDKFLNL